MTLEINPTSPTPSVKRNRSAGAPVASGNGSNGQRAEMRSNTSRPGTSRMRSQSPWASSGMNSMNRTMRPVARAKEAKSRISSSLRPRNSTTFTFNGVKPAASAASMARRTSLRAPRRRMAAKRSGRRESQLTFTRRRPAEASFSAIPGSSVPLVVTARSSNPSAANRAMSPGSPLRTSGSPPVIRSAVTPRLRATRVPPV